MARDRMIDLQRDRERVVLVGVQRKRRPGSAARGDLSLTELTRLVNTAGGDVVGELRQSRSRINSTYYIGTGKARELQELCRELATDLVVFDNDLTGAQARNLEKLINVQVIDRSELILDIFAKHARTSQAKLQVELAQLEYELPRLKRLWTHLSRYEGGIGMRGPGEKQLEEDKRVIRTRISALKRKFSRIERHRERGVTSRKAEFTISLVGYTNAGKSTLLNRLTGTRVATDNQLFVTLDTKTALWDLGSAQALLSDTVGFIRDIPHHLIASFHATLTEVLEADLLLHVVDASDPDAEQMAGVVNAVLKKLGCDGKPAILVLNKIDALDDPVELRILARSAHRSVAVSALTGEGLDRFKDLVLEEIESSWEEGTAEFPAADGKLLARLAGKGNIISRSYNGADVRLHMRLPVREANRLKRLSGVRWEPAGIKT